MNNIFLSFLVRGLLLLVLQVHFPAHANVSTLTLELGNSLADLEFNRRIAQDVVAESLRPEEIDNRQTKAIRSLVPSRDKLSTFNAIGDNKVKETSNDTSQALRVVVGLTVLAILPSILISVTSFLRIIIVLSMLRHAIGMQETPPNSALIGIALFLTLFTMSVPLQTVNQKAFQPFMAGKINVESAYELASAPMRDFMIRQTREQDLALMVELSKSKQPERMEDISNLQLIPAFMLSELRAAFQIGFVVFLPFLLIDLIVSSVLMALGMMMMPPVSIALPLKILMFILIDGWSLLLRALVNSFH